MKHNAYYPSRIAEQLIWLENFRNKISGYAVILGLSPAVLAAILADCRWLIYVLGSWLPAARAWNLSCTEASAEAQTGIGGSTQVLPAFAPPTPPPGVVAVNPGALTRIFALVQTLKDNPGLTDAIERDLGTVGSATTAPALPEVRPVLKVLINGTHAEVRWNWGGLYGDVDLLQIQVDRNDGKGWVDLVYDTRPNYTDPTAFPSIATIWKYRGIFHINGAPTGVWSDTVSVIVGA